MVRISSLFRREAFFFPLDLLTFLWSALNWVIRWSVVTLAVCGAVYLTASYYVARGDLSEADGLALVFSWKDWLRLSVMIAIGFIAFSGMLGHRSVLIPLPPRWSDAVDRVGAKLEAGLAAWGRRVDGYFAARVSEPCMKIVRVCYLVLPAILILASLAWLTHGIPVQPQPSLPPIVAPQGPQGGPGHE